MSLFHALQKWSARHGSGKTVATRAFLAHTFNSEVVKALTGSLEGTLRIFEPTDKEFAVNDLKLETNLHAPILQLEAGKFLRGSRYGLLVLFPTEFRVYDIHFGSVLKMTVAYKDSFGDSVAHMCVVGGFGGDFDNDLTCFQMMDGSLLFYESSRNIFKKILRNFLVPGPLAYVYSTDCFVTMNSEMKLECFSYRSISISNDVSRSSSRSHTPELTDQKELERRKQEGIVAEWQSNIGQHALDIQVGRFTPAAPHRDREIILLCERGVFVVSTDGIILWQVMLEYTPSCMAVYCRNPEEAHAKHYIMVASHQKSLHLYSSSRTLWVSMLNSVPCGIQVGKVKETQNMIISCSDEGNVDTNFLGTEHIAKNFVEEERGPSFADMTRRYKELQQEIKLFSKKKKSNDYIKLKVAHIGASQSEPNYFEDVKTHKHQIRLYITPSSEETIENIHINISPPHCASVDRKHIFIEQIDASTDVIEETITFSLKSNTIPVNLGVSIVVSHTVNHHPSYKQLQFDLPLLYVATPIKPMKGASQQIMLNTTTVPDLHELFSSEIEKMEPVIPSAFERAHLLSFQLRAHDAYVTIQTSKKGEPWICVRSENYHALALFVHEVVQRFDGGLKSFEWGCVPPESMLLEKLDSYWNAQIEYEETEKNIDRYASQLKAVQKRILIRLKDRIPAPLTNLELLLRDTHEGLLDIGRSRDDLRRRLDAEENLAFALMRIYTFFLAMAFGVDDANHSLVNHLVTDCCNEEAAQHWGPKSDAHIFYLLRTTFAKTSKDQAKTQPKIEQCDNLVKFKRHIRTLRDRLKKQGENRATPV